MLLKRNVFGTNGKINIMIVMIDSCPKIIGRIGSMEETLE
jgi:hypothetical protein